MLWQLLQSLAEQWSVQWFLTLGAQVSFQLSNQRRDPGTWMRVLAEAFEQMEDSRTRKNWVDQIDEGQQVLFEQWWKQAHQGFTRVGEEKQVWGTGTDIWSRCQISGNLI